MDRIRTRFICGTGVAVKVGVIVSVAVVVSVGGRVAVTVAGRVNVGSGTFVVKSPGCED